MQIVMLRRVPSGFGPPPGSGFRAIMPKSLTRFGDLSTGAIYRFHDLDGYTHVMKEIEREHLRAEGVAITPMVEADLELGRREFRKKILGDIRGRGVARHLSDLIRAASKKEAKRIIREVVVTQQEFVDLMFNCGDLRLAHRKKHRQFIPDHLKLSDEDRDAFFGNGVGTMSQGAQRVLRKVRSTFAERRCLSVHLFEGVGVWHCFWLTYEDARPDRRNHWRAGPHVHYLSHLFSRQTPDEVWSSFDARSVPISGEHIRFVD